MVELVERHPNLGKQLPMPTAPPAPEKHVPMASTTALWFHIETAFAEFEELCVQARAAELSVQKQKEERARRRGSFGGRAYDDDQTQPIQDGRFPRAQDLAKDLAFREAHSKGADLVEMARALPESASSWLKARFAEALSDHEVYYALFPIVVYSRRARAQSVTYGGRRCGSRCRASCTRSTTAARSSTRFSKSACGKTRRCRSSSRSSTSA